MNIKLYLRKLFDKLMTFLPDRFHTSVLKSYANQPNLSLRYGFRCYPQVFYSPLVNPEEVNWEKFVKIRDLPGIDLKLEDIFKLIDDLSLYKSEAGWMPQDKVSSLVEWHETYTNIDSYVLYCMLRHFKPSRYIEVGCGYSSRIASEALRRNLCDNHHCKASFIEPYPSPRLEGFNLFGDLIVDKVENISLDFFQELRAGDVLFIDTSHVLKCQNDVEWELLHILPSLSKGVLVHIHDIYTPYDQPYDWLFGRYAPGGTNEQYAVEALLSGGEKFEILLPLYLLGKDYPDVVSKIVGAHIDRGQSLWVKTKY